MRPRHWPFMPDTGLRRIGLMALIVAALVVVPVPFANWLPAASCFCIGVALTGRDGIWLAFATGIGVVAFAVFFAIILFAGLAVSAVTA